MTKAPNNKNLKTLARIAGSELKKVDGPRVAVFEVFGLIRMLHKEVLMVNMGKNLNK